MPRNTTRLSEAHKLRIRITTREAGLERFRARTQAEDDRRVQELETDRARLTELEQEEEED